MDKTGVRIGKKDRKKRRKKKEKKNNVASRTRILERNTSAKNVIIDIYGFPSVYLPLQIGVEWKIFARTCKYQTKGFHFFIGFFYGAVQNVRNALKVEKCIAYHLAEICDLIAA